MWPLRTIEVRSMRESRGGGGGGAPATGSTGAPSCATTPSSTVTSSIGRDQQIGEHGVEGRRVGERHRQQRPDQSGAFDAERRLRQHARRKMAGQQRRQAGIRDVHRTLGPIVVRGPIFGFRRTNSRTGR